MGNAHTAKLYVCGNELDAVELFLQLQNGQFDIVDAIIQDEVVDEQDQLKLSGYLAYKQLTLAETENVSWKCMSVANCELYNTTHAVEECMRDFVRHPKDAARKKQLATWLEKHAIALETHKEELTLTYKKIYVLNVMMLRVLHSTATTMPTTLPQQYNNNHSNIFTQAVVK